MAIPLFGRRAAGVTAAAAAAVGSLFWYRNTDVEANRPSSASVSFTVPMDLSCRHDRATQFAPALLSHRRFVAASATGTAGAAADKTDGRAKAKTQRRLKKRERRFQAFASCEFQGQLFMTAQDFLESVTQEAPRAREYRRLLSAEEVEKVLASTPGLKKSSSHLFREMWSSSLFSYPDYLFLLSILTKPQQHFDIAFRMLDVDGNERVDCTEFLKFQTVINHSSALSSGHEQRCSSLLVHLFGPKQTAVLNFPAFFTFMENLQTEVLEMEFLEFSQGTRVISEEEFADILLRTSHVSSHDVEEYKERVRERVTHSEGITFEQFRLFTQLLNNVSDFEIAMKMFTIAGQAVTQEEFQRAAKASMGVRLNSHVVDTIFKIFDQDGDGRLSHEEFVAVMRHRVQRGFETKRAGWKGFVACVKKQANR